MILKKYIKFSAIFLVLFFASCNKDQKDYGDFENHQWRLVHITTQEIDANVPQLANDKTRYVLTFNKGNGTMSMFLIVNRWSAHYDLLQDGIISVRGSTTTQVYYTGEEFWVERILNKYGSADYYYYVSGNKLVFLSEDINLYFVHI